MRLSQSVLDALADAETFRRFLADECFTYTTHSFEVLCEAPAPDPLIWKYPDTAYLQVRFVHAPAAFRNVPALRKA